MTIRGNDEVVGCVPGEELYCGDFTVGVLYNIFRDCEGNEYLKDNCGVRWYFN